MIGSSAHDASYIWVYKVLEIVTVAYLFFVFLPARYD